MKITTISKLLGACALLAASLSASALPSQKDVEAAVRAQNWSQAESMLLDVTTQKPNNAKAWYFLAQTEEKLNKFGDAQSDLSRAEKLDPAYKFASPGSVRAMEQRLTSEIRAVQAPSPAYRTQSTPVYSNAPSHDSGLGVVWLVLGLLFVFFIIYAMIRAVTGTRTTVYSNGGIGGGGVYPGGGSTTVINNGGSGTGLLGTMILADALRDGHRDHYRDDNYSQNNNSSSWDNDNSSPAPSNDSSSFDMGGSSGGWDSSSSSSDSGSSGGDSGGGSDW